MKFDRKFVLLAFVSLLLLSTTLGTSFITQAAYEQTINSDSVDPFPQAGKFYTLAGRTVLWEIVDGKNTTSHEEAFLKWSIQDVVGDVAFVNWTYATLYINPETGVNYTDTYDFDYQIATNRTILSAYRKGMGFTTAGFQWLASLPLDEDVGEHTWAWFPTDLYIGAYVLVSWTTDNAFLGDMLYEVVDDEVIQILGEKQDCWMLRMPPSITIDEARVRTETYWVDKDMGVPLKIYGKEWTLDGSRGYAYEYVLVNTNIDLGPESTQPPSPTYTLTVPTTPGFPEAGKFWSWYDLDEGWYMSEATNVTWYEEGLLMRLVTNITDDEALVYKIFWGDYLCDAEGIRELEGAEIWCTAYRADTTTREILEIVDSWWCGINMTSLTYNGPVDLTGELAGDVGEETYCWLPTNLYIGANVNITWSFDRPWKLDNATYAVVDEKIISALGEPQACWVLHLPPTPSIDGSRNLTETYYSDKDVGIPLECVGEGWAVDGSSASEYALQLMDTNVDLGPSFPQPGIFYTLAGRAIGWEIIEGEKTTHHEKWMDKWSVQDVDGDIAILNRTFATVYIYPETGAFRTETYDLDYEIATDRTILSAYLRQMYFNATGFESSWEGPLDMDIGEHIKAWFPVDLYVGALVPVGWTGDGSFLGDMLYEVVGEEVIEIIGEKQDCWMLRMPPSITIDGARVLTNTWWVDKETGVPLKAYWKGWALDGSWGFEEEDVLVHTNIDLGPESTQTPSPTYTLTVPTTPGFPETGKFYTWYLLNEGWYMSDATNVTYYEEGLLTRLVINITDDEALVYKVYWAERICDAEGIGELESAEIWCTVHRIGITTREILEVVSSWWCGINMTSLTYDGPVDLTGELVVDVGEEAYCWLPTNLYIGAAVNITWSFDRPWTLDNATYTVVDEEIIAVLGELQTCWVLHLPLTLSIDGTWNHSETYYSDKDVGIPLGAVGEGWAVDGSSAYVSTVWIIDTNVDLGPEVVPRTMVFFNINPNPATAGETVTFKGILIDENANPLANQTVRLYARPLARSWRYITSLTTNGHGIFKWQATIPAHATGTYILAAYYPGSETYESSYNFVILIVQ